MRASIGIAAAAIVAAWAVPGFGQSSGSVRSSPTKWGASLDLEGKLGTDRSLGEGDLFLPLAQDGHTLMFGDLRMRFDDADSKEGNFGVGLRHMSGAGWNLGAYGYFDRRRTETGHLFSQLTFGAEALGRDWDLRVNSYWPVGRTVKYLDSSTSIVAALSGAAVEVTTSKATNEEHALRGFDTEVGWRVPAFASDGPLDLRLYGGGFTFDDPDSEGIPDITGPRLRAELTSYEVPSLWNGTRLTLGAEWQHDDVRGSQGFASLRLRIPLQSETQRSRRLTAQERRMTAPIVRDVDIVSGSSTTTTVVARETATETTGGSSITVLDSATTTGAGLPGAVSAAGANSTVILSGSFSPTVTVTLQSGQTVMGAGSLTVRCPSGLTAVLTTSAATVTAPGDKNNPSFKLANNSTLSGLTINTTDALAVSVLANSTSGATIADNTITATNTGGTAMAVYVASSSGAVVRGNTITATGSAGQTVDSLALYQSDATVSGNTLDASGATNNYYVSIAGGVTVNAGSTGNIKGGGTCNNPLGATGQIGFTDGGTCP